MAILWKQKIYMGFPPKNLQSSIRDYYLRKGALYYKAKFLILPWYKFHVFGPFSCKDNEANYTVCFKQISRKSLDKAKQLRVEPDKFPITFSLYKEACQVTWRKNNNVLSL